MNNTKRKIFDSAIELFSKKGYDSSSMDEIASNAEVAKGTLYYHFKSKEDLFGFIIEEIINIIYKGAHDRAHDISNPLQKIEAICRYEMEIALEKRSLFKMFLSELWSKQIRQEEVRKKIKEYIFLMVQLIEEAQQDGSVKEGDSTVMAYNIFGAFISTGIYEITAKDRIVKSRIIDESIDFILKGIRA